MRKFSTFVAAAAVAVTTVALTAGPALADPPGSTVPKDTSIVSVGADTTEFLFDQIDLAYNKTKPTNVEYSWDATNPNTGAQGDTIVTKAKCAGIARPNGSGQGLSALEANARPTGNTTNYCVDYARVARNRASTDPACNTGGVCFVSLAGDAVSWADRTNAAGGTDAPKSLTSAQLAKIYECQDTNWKQVGGSSAPIEAFLPVTSSGVRTFFLTALGGGTTPITPGACVSDENNTLEQNQGVDPVLDSPETIYIYSVGDYISQVYHSATCTNNPDCGFPDAPTCAPTKTQNSFGCNQSGVLQLGEISDRSPLTTAKVPTINPSFSPVFQRSLFDTVRYDPNTTDHIPGGEAGSPGGLNLETFLGSTGYLCTNATAKKDIIDYGFLNKWKLSTCGAVS
jgi:ABC-type phosphate transport system substrate-binding protein